MTLANIVETRRVVVCAGAGGVGKTTVAAALALGAAGRGRRVLCLTIDPAKRLADSLGFAGTRGETLVVDPERLRALGLPAEASLSVSMLDTKRTFDDIVARHAPSAAVRDRILDNRFYQYVSTSLAGTQSYMAMEKVLAVLDDQRYDLVILDTPPTSDALDFLEAPERLVEALDSPAMRWLVDAFEPTRRLGLGALARSVAGILRGMGRLSHYAASKWGLTGLTKSWAIELAPHNIRVVSIHPTGVNSPMNDGLAAMEGLTPREIAERSAGNLLPVPWIEPEDVAQAVVYLASDKARFVTGSQFVIDAGLLTR